MKIELSDFQRDSLKLDAKTLVDISKMLEMDGRFKVLPNILGSIAMDIVNLLHEEPSEEETDDGD